MNNKLTSESNSALIEKLPSEYGKICAIIFVLIGLFAGFISLMFLLLLRDHSPPDGPGKIYADVLLALFFETAVVIFGVAYLLSIRFVQARLEQSLYLLSASELALAIASSGKRKSGFSFAKRRWRVERRTEFAQVWLMQQVGKRDLFGVFDSLGRIERLNELVEVQFRLESKMETTFSLAVPLAAIVPHFSERCLAVLVPFWRDSGVPFWPWFGLVCCIYGVIACLVYFRNIGRSLE